MKPALGAYRIGSGNDVHRLVAGRKLILGGVDIPFERGPEGHSDGDALAHAICDALLGAAGLGDIGRHFPNRSPKWRNASSLLFLRQVAKLLGAAGYAIVNIDSTVGLELAEARALPSADAGSAGGSLGNSARPGERQG